MSAPLAGKAVLVTGASAGIGRAAAVALAQKGAKIIATGRRKGELNALAQQCGGGAVETIAGDLNDAGFVDELAKRAARRRHLPEQCRRAEIRAAHGHDRRRLRGHVPHQCAGLVPGHAGGGEVDGGAPARPHHRHDLDRGARSLSAGRDLLRDQARAVGLRPRLADRAAGPRHQGHRNRARHGGHRHPRQQHSSGACWRPSRSENSRHSPPRRSRRRSSTRRTPRPTAVRTSSSCVRKDPHNR